MKNIIIFRGALLLFASLLLIISLYTTNCISNGAYDVNVFTLHLCKIIKLIVIPHLDRTSILEFILTPLGTVPIKSIVASP